MGVTRRDFVKKVGAGGIGLGLSAAGLGAAEADAAPAAARQDDEIWIDALAGTRLGDEGLDEIRRSGLTMLETTLGPAGTPTFSYEAAVRDIARWHANFAAFRDHILHVRTAADIREAKRSGRLGVMLGFQNATHLNRTIENLDFFHSLGIRQIQLTYNEMNALGVGCTERVDAGLSDFGVAAVRRMNELGILVDLSHVGYRTTLDGIEHSSAPPIFSHTNARALTPGNARCKTDEEIKALAAKGGVMGMTTVNFFVSPKPRSTLDDYMRHFVYVADLVGPEHVGIGTDASIAGWRVNYPDEETFWRFHGQFDFKPAVQIRWPPYIEEIDVPERYHIFRAALGRHGFSAAETRGIMGGNFLRVYEQVLGNGPAVG